MGDITIQKINDCNNTNLVLKPLITVIFPAYNCEKYIKESLDTIVNQTYPNLEILVCDDASKDRTRSIIDGYSDSRIKRFHNQSNIGYLKTWNKLIQHSNGKYITFLDADDTCSPHRIEIMVNFLELNLHIGVVGSNIHRINTKGKITKSSKFVLEHEKIVQKMPHQFDIVGSSVMLRKEILDEIGGYNEFFDRIGAEDLYWLYLISEKYRICNLPDHLYSYRFNENSVMGNLTNHPQKLFISEVLSKLIQQRRETGTDDIELGNWESLYHFLNLRLNEVGNAKDTLFHYVAKRRYYEGHRKQAVSLMKRAIMTSPFSIHLYRDLIYFWRNKS